MTSDDEIEGTTFKVYLYVMKANGSVGPRDVMRGLELSSPSVAYRHLQKLLDLGLVEKDESGNYLIKEKASFKGFLWIGRTLVSRLILYSLFFFGSLMVESVVLSIRISAGQSIDNTFMLLIIVTAISASLFMFEGYKLKQRATS